MENGNGLYGKTHREHVAEGYYVWVRYCKTCGIFLGVNYPSDFCSEHRENPWD